MNILDKVIAPFSPQRALSRAVARKKLEAINNLGYDRHGASTHKKSLRGWFSRAGSPDDDITKNQGKLRERSRDLFMGNPLATGAIKTIRTNVVGSGLKLNANIDAEFLGLTPAEARAREKHTEREFRLWADSVNCDASRMCTFGQLQSLVQMAALSSGDVFATLPVIKRKGAIYDLCVYLIEGDRVCNPDNVFIPDMYGGIELGEYSDPVAYWIAKHHPASTSGFTQRKWERIPAYGKNTGRRNVLHVMQDWERPGQRRGVPVLAPVIEALKQLGRYTDAELVAAVVSGLFTVFVKTEAPEGPIGEGGIPTYEQIDNYDENTVEMGSGSVVSLADGESVETANPGRPNTAFDGFVVAICRQIGAALELPYELLVKHFTASYSASRAALLEAWKMFRMRREWMVLSFCQPVYEEWLSEAVAKGRVIAPGFFHGPEYKAAWCGAQWYGPSQGQLDPLKEAKAAKLRVDETFSTREKETAEMSGLNWEETAQIRGREEDTRRELKISSVQETAEQTEVEDQNV
ncbi:phage portal protein [Salmonella enterica]|uniref:phage portal protein n=1 Tax=Salmonella enterica TaxID=28901 RepID=UPI0003A4D461|nr:phage portal protein [Salmonella enterica]EDW5052424.1 phage portal protein [Salmonella enterica subsp. enterica serovar Hartford]EBI3076571.1 phage portal protein [Salmonella enterica]ECL8573073.1 phage portal protein [Salmonella enterica]EEJ2568674.1 phage portal protein [Salmonella enterica subsp. enterica serovar Hartford]EEJ3999447.1 phage portal protein [Salmonella enterica subsp. enterica serovar Hartford]